MFPHCPLSRDRDHARRSGESGQALVETAFTLIMLTVMLLGVVEVGRIAWAAIQVTNAAKAAVQYGDIDFNNSGDTTGMQNAAADAAPDLSNLTTNIATTCLCADTTACLTPSSSVNNRCPGSATVLTLHVTTASTFNPIIHLPGTPNTYTLHGWAVQQVLSSGF